MPAGLRTRALSSVAVVLVAVALVYGPRLVFTGVVLLLAAIGVSEMYGLLAHAGNKLPLPFGLALVGLLVLSAARVQTLFGVSVFLCIVAPLLWGMHGGTPQGAGLGVWASGAIGALYVGWPLAHLELLRFLPEGRAWLIFAIACTWATDTGAYITGQLWGRHKLAPRISPGKTIEGSLGALVITVLAGGIVEMTAGLPVSFVGTLLVALLLSVTAQAGDLAESYIKRVGGAKDSGRLIPGHGGLLDRIDGLLWVIVATYYLAIAAT